MKLIRRGETDTEFFFSYVVYKEMQCGIINSDNTNTHENSYSIGNMPLEGLKSRIGKDIFYDGGKLLTWNWW